MRWTNWTARECLPKLLALHASGALAEYNVDEMPSLQPISQSAPFGLLKSALTSLSFEYGAVGHGLHAAPWADDRPGAHVVRAAKTSVWTPEPGHICPISMTYAVVPALRHNPELAAVYEPLLTSRAYDPVLAIPTTKAGITAGMSMTEKQGGSDVRTNTTRAVPDGEGYLLTGHKYFCSAPMSDAFLTLAYTDAGLSCFLVPRWTPDGQRNNLIIQRLKDKLGNRSNASSEMEFQDTWGVLVGEDGRGIRTIIDMVKGTRYYCCFSSTALMRQKPLSGRSPIFLVVIFSFGLNKYPLLPLCQSKGNVPRAESGL